MSTICPSLREEFRLNKLLFSGIHSERFYNFHWRLPPLLFVLYRLGVAVYVDFWLIYFSTIYSEVTPIGKTLLPWPCFLTNWTYTVLALFVTVHALTVFTHYMLNPSRLCYIPTPAQHKSVFHELSSSEEHRRSGYEPIVDNDFEMDVITFNNTLPWYLIIVWILMNTVSSCAVVVTTVFFAFLLPQEKGVSGISMENLQIHILNSVIIVVEHLVMGIPLRILHFVYPFVFGLAYILFSVFYWIPDHSHVMYPGFLDWNYPAHTTGMVVLVGFVFFPILHALYYVIYRIKIFILKHLPSDQNEVF